MSCDKCSRAYSPLVGFYIFSTMFGTKVGGFLQKVRVDDDALSRLVRY